MRLAGVQDESAQRVDKIGSSLTNDVAKGLCARASIIESLID